jgi:hypothetical protein
MNDAADKQGGVAGMGYFILVDDQSTGCVGLNYKSDNLLVALRRDQNHSYRHSCKMT